ncbi:hypothetical protein [Pseudonocardia endophytica]|uniref:Uncharacterized protein n=1 Tax=Pseudonocardia endophytica TaxID=401976 RepID=A0A4R1HYC3_PSEEN|nr:hypothetical protein [Pseudonocardia endophytica]TCK27408.1 hypothetical protein EV378_3279 [Pseudonocardia endophytica]
MKVTWDGGTLKIELDEPETQKLLGALKSGDATAVKVLLSAAGLSNLVVGIVVAALVLHATWEAALISDADKGDGVFLTQPAFPLGGAVVVPQTRYVQDIPSDWASRDTGTFVSDHGDRVAWSIERGAIPAGVAAFRLRDEVADSREFRLRDGTGGEWTVQARPGTQAENGLYADQLGNGQQFTFRRPTGFLDVWTDAFAIGGIEGVRGGDRVTYTWTA